jgi:hypothetical protein
MRTLFVFILLLVGAVSSRAQPVTKFFKFWESGMGIETFGSTDSARTFSTSRTVFTYQYSLNIPIVHIGESSNISISPGIGMMLGHPVPTDDDKLGIGLNIPAFLTYRSGTDATYYHNTKWGFAAGAGVQETMLLSYDPEISMLQPSIMLEGSTSAIGHKAQLVKLRFTYGVGSIAANSGRIDSRFGLYFIYVPGF